MVSAEDALLAFRGAPNLDPRRFRQDVEAWLDHGLLPPG
jgi:hypothetical protein